MGEVFARAKLLHIWLGSSSDANQIRQPMERLLGREVRDCDGLVFHCHTNWDGVDYEVFDNKHWSRAWVTQGIILAHTLIASLGMRVFHYVDLFHQMKQIGRIRAGTSFHQFNRILNSSATPIRGSSLLYLLWCFNGKDCSVKHDRVYSLLSLSDQREDRTRLRYLDKRARLSSPGTLW
jgi:hypothetical protein